MPSATTASGLMSDVITWQGANNAIARPFRQRHPFPQAKPCRRLATTGMAGREGAWLDVVLRTAAFMWSETKTIRLLLLSLVTCTRVESKCSLLTRQQQHSFTYWWFVTSSRLVLVLAHRGCDEKWRRCSWIDASGVAEDVPKIKCLSHIFQIPFPLIAALFRFVSSLF